MAAILGSLKGNRATDATRRVRFGNVEPAVVALLRQLDPTLVVLLLLGWVWALGEQFTHEVLGVGLLSFIITTAIFARASSRDQLRGHSRRSSYSRIFLHWSAVVAALLFLGFAFKVSADFPRSVMLTWFVTTPFLLSAAHALRLRTRWVLVNSPSASRYLIIGVNNLGFELRRRLPEAGFLGFFDFRSAERVSPLLEADELTGHCRDVANFARTHNVKTIYVTLPLSNVPRIGEMMRELRDTTASIYFLPDVFAFEMIQGRLIDINGIPALSVCETPLLGMNAVVKRAFDVVAAGLALVAAAPLMAVIAAAVKLTSPGPVLFRQGRYGLNGERINVYKFRSMTVCEDGAVVTQATQNDTRVTPIGRFLRRSSLDELPQLLNVLQGKMSLVGPRPHAVAHNEQYRKLISGYMTRHKVRPGITGWAQVNGLRGETDTIDKMSARVRYDIEYLDNWSVWLDVRIIMQTALLLIRKDRNAY